MKRTPEQIAEAAVEWRVGHPEEFEYMAREAFREAGHRGWASIHNCADKTRMDLNIKISNTIKPALSRMLVLEYPRLGKYLVLKKSSVDEVDIAGIYRERGLDYGEA